VLLARDVTLAREVDRMKTDFIATVSHELRTPLTSVLGFAKLARSKIDVVGPHVAPEHRKAQRAIRQVRGNLDIIVSEGVRLSELINDVLDISKMEAGRVDWNTDPIEPAELITHAINVTTALFERGGVDCLVDIEDELPVIEGDRDRLLQVVINLVSNAAKFTREGSVTIAVRTVVAGVEFSVTDTGPGIAAVDHVAIFERFKQSSSDTLTDRPNGTGLGLPISKHIVEHHGGRIWVESALGVGSRFAFTLPAPHTTRGPSALSNPAFLQALLARVNDVYPRTDDTSADILVVDDDASVRALLQQILTDAGHHVRLAADGMAAVDEVRRTRPDLLVLDVLMPGLSGFDVAALLRADPATEALPILVLSVLRDQERGVRIGVDRYLTKPVDGDVLVGTVDRLLERVNGPRRVLVVDDDGAQALALQGLLEAEGSVVVGRSTADAMVARAHDLQPDLVVVSSPESGALEALRNDPALAAVKVVVLVGD
jgi:CheY-like chemotaxis protein